jgi:O-antigen/teichoic acid export membrane protein
MVTADWALGIFGSEYAKQAAWCLRILSLAVFPITIKNLYVAIYRIRNRIWAATRLIIIGGFLELLLATAGGKMGGLVGLSIGWVSAVMIEGLIMSPIVFKVINTKGAFDESLSGELAISTKTV